MNVICALFRLYWCAHNNPWIKNEINFDLMEFFFSSLFLYSGTHKSATYFIRNNLSLFVATFQFIFSIPFEQMVNTNKRTQFFFIETSIIVTTTLFHTNHVFVQSQKWIPFINCSSVWTSCFCEFSCE